MKFDLKKLLERIGNFFKRNFFAKIDIYFYLEFIPNYLFGLAFFTALIMLNELYYLARYYFEYNVPFNQVMLLLLNLIPFLLSFSVPFAVLPAYLLTMGRFSQDSEIIAMKSCGISTIRLIRPGIIFGILITLFAVQFKDKIEIPANLNYVRLKAKIMAQKPAIEFKERAFLELGGFKISYDDMETVNGIDILYDLYVVDVDGRKVIESERGRFFSNPQNPEHYILKFMDGSITEISTVENDDGEEEELSFYVSFDYLALNSFVSLPDEYYSKGPDTMSLQELDTEIDSRSEYTLEKIISIESQISTLQDRMTVIRKEYLQDLKADTNNMREEIKADYLVSKQYAESQIKSYESTIEDYRKGLPIYYIMKYHDKFAMPVAAFVFALISLSLGMYTARSGRGEGLGISILIMLIFYGMKVGVENVITKSLLSPFLIWVPNLIFLTVGMILFVRKVRE